MAKNAHKSTLGRTQDKTLLKARCGALKARGALWRKASSAQSQQQRLLSHCEPYRQAENARAFWKANGNSLQFNTRVLVAHNGYWFWKSARLLRAGFGVRAAGARKNSKTCESVRALEDRPLSSRLWAIGSSRRNSEHKSTS